MDTSKSRHREAWGRCVEGASPEVQRALIEAWLCEDERPPEQAEKARLFWSVPLSFDVDIAWEKLSSRIERERRAEPARKPVRRERRGRRFAPGQRVVGGLVLAAAITLLLFQFYGSETPVSPTVEARTFTTERGQRSIVQLNDGTRVQLNVDSELIVPTPFSPESRQVQLRGEAFFEVAGDSARPFQVRTPYASVQVLGTRFDVRTYIEDFQTQVVVAEGKVTVHSNEGSPASGLTLTANQLGQVGSDGSMQRQSDVDLDQYLAWQEDRLVFEDTPLRDVVAQLERWYDLDIRLADSTMETLPLTATFTRASANEVLRVIAATLNLRIEQEGGLMTLSPARPPSNRKKTL